MPLLLQAQPLGPPTHPELQSRPLFTGSLIPFVDPRHLSTPVPKPSILNELARELEARKVIDDPSYFKFAIVRHPWSRIVSGFRSKYLGGDSNSSRVVFSKRYAIVSTPCDLSQ